ncbi:MAG: FkbM family methyltransferase, partial [Terracidiphilus sp.]
IGALLHLSRRLRHPDIPLDHAVTRVSYRQREFTILHRRWGSDQLAIAQCFDEAQYDMPTGAHGALIERVYRAIIASGKRPLIVDCGANIGASVLWFTARYPEAQIIALEPSPTNFAFLARNCAGLEVDLRQAGIGPVDGVVWMSNPEDEWGCKTNDRHEGIAIESLSVETLLASKPESEFSPFLLKVDIEGAEKSLFAGPTAVLDRFPLIIVEPHDWLFPGQRTSVEFFRFHALTGREFAMNNENVASIACDPKLVDSAEKICSGSAWSGGKWQRGEDVNG